MTFIVILIVFLILLAWSPEFVYEMCALLVMLAMTLAAIVFLAFAGFMLFVALA